MEHIYEISKFVDNAFQVLKSDGLIYYTIPNYLSSHAVNREPHTGVFGLTIEASAAKTTLKSSI